MTQIGCFEIHADDPARAARFYSAVFGWRFEHEVLLGIDYWRIDGAQIPGGLLQRPIAPGQGTNAFVVSMLVDDLDAASAAILDAGGTLAMPRFAVPGRSWHAYFQDPEGNTLGILQPDPAAA